MNLRKTTNPVSAEPLQKPCGVRGIRMSLPRLIGCATLAAVVASVPVATGSQAPAPTLVAPTGLQTFLKTIREERSVSSSGIPEFARTPAFAWGPVRKATKYEFELSTSPVSNGDSFSAGNGLVWSSRTLTTPAAAIPISLPWITGQPASLYWHVRALAGRTVSPWSETKAFNMRWSDIPKQLPVKQPGYLRWSIVDGATGYQVWFVKANKVIGTITNVADEREFYAFHDDPAWTGDVEWRVRAVRAIYGASKNALPAVSFGPWSPKYHSTNASNPLDSGTEVTPVATVSDVVSAAGAPKKHELMPAFLFSGNGDSSDRLHRVYVFSDRDCVNVVYRGAIVAGPAYAPRTTGTLELPATATGIEEAQSKFLADGDEGATFAADTDKVRATEAGEETAVATTEAPEAAASSSQSVGGSAKVDLWDRSWPSGRYYWTVVPVRAVVTPEDAVEYRETELPQDACQGQVAKAGQPAIAPRVSVFGKQSAGPAPANAKQIPYATGLSPFGKLLSAATGKRSFYGSPLVAWTAAPSAVSYDVEWSKTSYPWRPAGHLRTPATAAILPLKPGTWWYRVRGINESIPGNQKMQWSASARIEIAKPTFAVKG